MSISVDSFGAAGNGTTNDRVAIQNALNSLTPSGGTVTLGDNKVYRIAGGDLTIPKGVTLKGAVSFNGHRGTNAAAAYNNQAGIVADPAYKIKLMGGACIDGILIRPYGMTFPQTSDLAYTGTAIQFMEDDGAVLNSMVIGFEMAIYAEGVHRGRVERFNTDCVNGIRVKTSWDIWYLREVHCWPFGTIAGHTTEANVTRRGYGIQFEEGGDWNKITDCFTYGYQVGVHVKNCNSMTLTGVGTDNFHNINRQSIGILIEGNCLDTKLIGCQAAASTRGVAVHTSPASTTIISELTAWANGIGLHTTAQGTVQLVNSVFRAPVWVWRDDAGAGAVVNTSMVLH